MNEIWTDGNEKFLNKHILYNAFTISKVPVYSYVLLRLNLTTFNNFVMQNKMRVNNNLEFFCFSKS